MRASEITTLYRVICFIDIFQLFLKEDYDLDQVLEHCKSIKNSINRQ